MMKVVMLSDMHVGSDCALADFHETPKNSPGKKAQEGLYNAWKAATSGPWSRPDALIIAGDAVDGQGSKDAGVHQWTTDPTQQVNHAAHLIEMWHAKRIFICGGSNYHVQVGEKSGVSAEEMLAQKIKAEPYPNQDHIPEEDRKRSGAHWFLTFENVSIHVAHHVSVSRVFAYKSTAIAREMMAAKLNDPLQRGWKTEWEKMYRASTSKGKGGLRKKLIKIDDLLQLDPERYQIKLVVRGHAHYYWLSDAGGTMGINLPCWKAPDDYIASRDSLGFTHIGFVGLNVNGKEFEAKRQLWRIEDVSPIPHTIVPSGVQA